MYSPSDYKVGDTIKAGTIVILTEGEYSSYCYLGVFEVLEDIVLEQRAAPNWAPERDMRGKIDLRKICVDPRVREIVVQEVWSSDY